MTDSNVPEELAARHERNREQRIAGIKRWVEYIKSEPPEVWGPQQNAVVNDQLEAAQTVETSVSHRQRVESLAAEIIDEREANDT
jgi:purine nucleoside phosphorylase